MQAMILAAGLGTRLKPYTTLRPKPLFTIDGTTLLERHIHTLVDAGCDSIIINTCHLASEIHRFIHDRSWPVPIHIQEEAVLLDSAGAVANVAAHLRDAPLLVVNGDTLTDIDPRALLDAHLKKRATATLALIHHPEFNKVSVDDTGQIHRFRDATPEGMIRRTFTGMQILSPEAVAAIPRGIPFGLVDLYRALIRDGKRIQGFTVTPGLWFDCGTPQRYLDASKALMVPKAFFKAFGRYPDTVKTQGLKGDGSDRLWSRLSSPDGSIICCENGIHSDFDRGKKNSGEARAMIRIGTHLKAQGIPCSPILAGDSVSGVVLVQDAGDTHLMDLAQTLAGDEREHLYEKIIEVLIRFSQKGIRGFDTAWCWQTPAYDKQLIITLECHAFMERFINGYLGLNEGMERYEAAFRHIADKALTGSVTGLMHRDFQSRNIMMVEAPGEASTKNYTPVIIDFQGARRGPLQYDLASLLIDPYTALPHPRQERLLAYATGLLHREHDPDFATGYTFCAIARNLQILGAFGGLTLKGKSGFKAHIPQALTTLENRLKRINDPILSPLKCLVERARQETTPSMVKVSRKS